MRCFGRAAFPTLTPATLGSVSLSLPPGLTPEMIAAQMAQSQPQLTQETIQEIMVLQLRLEGIGRQMMTVSHSTPTRVGSGVRLTVLRGSGVRDRGQNVWFWLTVHWGKRGT